MNTVIKNSVSETTKNNSQTIPESEMTWDDRFARAEKTGKFTQSDKEEMWHRTSAINDRLKLENNGKPLSPELEITSEAHAIETEFAQDVCSNYVKSAKENYEKLQKMKVVLLTEIQINPGTWLDRIARAKASKHFTKEDEDASGDWDSCPSSEMDNRIDWTKVEKSDHVDYLASDFAEYVKNNDVKGAEECLQQMKAIEQEALATMRKTSQT